MIEPEIPKNLAGILENVHLFLKQESRIVGHLAAIEQEYCKLLNSNTNTPKMVPMFLLVTGYRSFLAACTLNFSVQLPATYSIQRSILESAAYAFYINEDPHRKDVYLKRDQDEAAKKIARSEFTAAKVGKHMESVDKKLHSEYQKQYERTIMFGGHPNLEIFRSYIDKVEGFTYTMGIFENNPDLVNNVSDDIIRTNEISLEIFRRVFAKS